MPLLLWIILGTLLVSLLSLAGILSLAVNEDLLRKSLLLLVGFSAGALLGGAFLHLLPEALENLESSKAFFYTLIGFILFFLLERIFYWRHCHHGVCDAHAFTYLNLLGDSLHNFIDGLVIAGSFVSGIPLGIVTSLVVALHELPQEIGDFGVLVYGGFTKLRALFYNLITALTAVLGGILGYFLAEVITGFASFLLPFTAGGFIYIAASDLIPEVHKGKDAPQANYAFFTFLLGILFIWTVKILEH